MRTGWAPSIWIELSCFEWGLSHSALETWKQVVLFNELRENRNAFIAEVQEAWCLQVNFSYWRIHSYRVIKRGLPELEPVTLAPVIYLYDLVAGRRPGLRGPQGNMLSLGEEFC